MSVIESPPRTGLTSRAFRTRCRAENAELSERARVVEERLRQASSAQRLLLDTVEERREKVEGLAGRAAELERELHDARTQGRSLALVSSDPQH